MMVLREKKTTLLHSADNAELDGGICVSATVGTGDKRLY